MWSKKVFLIVESAINSTSITDFPMAGQNEEISFQNSKFKVFDAKYVKDLKDNWPEIWKLGGNILGNKQFNRLYPIVGRKPNTQIEYKAIKLREAWSARHFRNHRISGVVALMKWLTVGSIGEAAMKDIVEKQKKKLTQ